MTDTKDGGVTVFDPMRIVALYRDIVEDREATTNEADKTEFDRMAGILRESWKRRHGEDSLHSLAVGEPAE